MTKEEKNCTEGKREKVGSLVMLPLRMTSTWFCVWWRTEGAGRLALCMWKEKIPGVRSCPPIYIQNQIFAKTAFPGL